MEKRTMLVVACTYTEAALLLGHCLAQEINLELNQTGLCNFPLAASLILFTQNISTIAWLYLLLPLIELVYL